MLVGTADSGSACCWATKWDFGTPNSGSTGSNVVESKGKVACASSSSMVNGGVARDVVFSVDGAVESGSTAD